MDKKSRVWVAGASGMVGSAILRRLRRTNADVLAPSHAQVDLVNQAETRRWVSDTRPEFVFMAAGTVGGIGANNSNPADFLYENLMIQANVLNMSRAYGVQKLLFLGSSCIYPNNLTRPIREDDLLQGPLEPTNEWYALAKITGIKLCDAYRRQYKRNFISCMPTNMYGPGDNYDAASSHVVAALIAKIHRAKQNADTQVTLWGTGTPRREIMYVDDFADACVFLMKNYNVAGHINVGTGVDMTILELAQAIAKVVGWDGEFVLDKTKPDGTMRKTLDTSRLNALGWHAWTGPEVGLRQAYAAYLATL